MKLNKTAEKAIAVAIAILLWQLAATALSQEILLVSPVKVFFRLINLIADLNFWNSVWFSFWRIVSGFILGVSLGTVLAVIADRYHIAEIFLWPYMSVIKATPVASFIILCLIWLNSANLPIFIAFLMVLPIVYTNMLSGLRSTDVKMLQMAKVFNFSWGKQLKYIYLPQVKPYIISACKVSLGLAWKAGIAAEVIGIPAGSIGEMLYEAKVYLATADLFAWTVVVVTISMVFEKVILWLLKKFYKMLEV